MLELAGAIVLAVLILVYIGQFVVLAAALYGVLLGAAAGALVHFLRATPGEVAFGIVAAAIIIASLSRDEDPELRRASPRK
jgi:hypothetical protein